MNNQLKQRLVGAIVLVALAVIFIPMLLPGKGDLSGSIDGSNIPPEPDFRFPPVPTAPKAPPMAEALPIPLGDEVEAKQEPTKLAATVSKSAAKAVAKPKPKPAAKAAPKPVVKPIAKPSAKLAKKTVPSKTTSGNASAWVVQVGSFSARNNARGLRDKLRQQGHASFMERISGADGPVYRVRVGPELSKQAAQKLRQRLQKEAGLKGLVQAYP